MGWTAGGASRRRGARRVHIGTCGAAGGRRASGTPSPTRPWPSQTSRWPLALASTPARRFPWAMASGRRAERCRQAVCRRGRRRDPRDREPHAFGRFDARPEVRAPGADNPEGHRRNRHAVAGWHRRAARRFAEPAPRRAEGPGTSAARVGVPYPDCGSRSRPALARVALASGLAVAIRAPSASWDRPASARHDSPPRWPGWRCGTGPRSGTWRVAI